MSSLRSKVTVLTPIEALLFLHVISILNSFTRPMDGKPAQVETKGFLLGLCAQLVSKGWCPLSYIPGLWGLPTAFVLYFCYYTSEPRFLLLSKWLEGLSILLNYIFMRREVSAYAGRMRGYWGVCAERGYSWYIAISYKFYSWPITVSHFKRWAVLQKQELVGAGMVLCM